MGTKVTSGLLGDNAVGANNLPAGSIAQVVYAETASVATGTTTVPVDDTIPQNTEGTEFLTATITPSAADSTLIVDVSLSMSASAAINIVSALFRDSTANAIAATTRYCAGNNQMTQINLRAKVTAGSTSATTFKLRAGPASAATVTINGLGGVRYFGGVWVTSITITEVLV